MGKCLIFLLILSSFVLGLYAQVFISSCKDLQQIRLRNATNIYNLVQNLDCSHTDFALPSNLNAAFQGFFTGNGYKISNVLISSSDRYVGLFAACSGCTVRDLSLENFTVVASSQKFPSSAGALFGSALNCSVTNVNVSNSYITASKRCGAIAGHSEGGDYFKSRSTQNTISCISRSGSECMAGGLTGESAIRIMECEALDNIINASSPTSAYAGGITGKSNMESLFFISKSIRNSIHARSYQAYAAGISAVSESVDQCISDHNLITSESTTSLLALSSAAGISAFNERIISACNSTNNRIEARASPLSDSSLYHQSTSFAGGISGLSNSLIPIVLKSNSSNNVISSTSTDSHAGGISATCGTVLSSTSEFNAITSSSNFIDESFPALSHAGGVCGAGNGSFSNITFTFSLNNNISCLTDGSQAYCGGVISYNNGVLNHNSANKNQIRISSTSEDKNNYNGYAGGIAGMNDGILTNCDCSFSNINATSASRSPYFAHSGGISGCNLGTVSYCFSNRNSIYCSAPYTCFAGGVNGVGFNTTITHSFGNIIASAPESETPAMSAGIDAYQNGWISGCFSFSNRLFSDIAGGIVGIQSVRSNLVNCQYSDNSYEASEVSGLCVAKQEGNISNCTEIH